MFSWEPRHELAEQVRDLLLAKPPAFDEALLRG